MKQEHSALLLLLAGFILLFLFLPNNDQGYDSYSYSLAVREGNELIHPHHLLYNLFGWLLYQLFKFTGLGSLKILSLANSILGALTLGLVYKIILNRATMFTAIIATILTGFLYSFWYYSTSVEVNMPALLLFCLGIYCLIARPHTGKNSTLAYIFIAAGVLFHQVLVLAVLPIAVYDIMRNKSFFRALKYALPGLSLGFLAYMAVALIAAPEKNLGGLFEWLTFYAHLGAWGKLTTSNATSGLWGLIKTFYGGDAIRQVFYTGTWTAASTLYLVLIAAISAGFMGLMALAVANLANSHNREQWLLMALVVIFGLFAFWWAPGDEGFWLYPAIMLLLFLFDNNSCSDIKKRFRQKTALMVMALLVIINLTFGFIPSSNKANSLVHQGVSTFRRLDLTGDDLVLTNFSRIRLAYDYYYGVYVPTTCLMYAEKGEKADVIRMYYNSIKETLKRGRVFIFEDELHPQLHRRYLFERFSPEEYIMVYSPFLGFLAPVDSLKVYGKKVRLYRISSKAGKY